MEELILINNLLTYRGLQYSVGTTQQVNDAVFVNLKYDDSQFEVTVVANEVSINGIVQTSAQMIIDTLSSDGQS
jgi:hypothetical protein